VVKGDLVCPSVAYVQLLNLAEFVVVTVLVKTCSIFGGTTPRGPLNSADVWRNMSPLFAWHLLGLVLDPEDAGDTFLRKFRPFSADYTT
jgi:hypothetical protein